LQQGQTPEFEELQKNDATFYACGRPLGREASVPLTLLHPIFGRFVDNCGKIILMCNDYNIASQLKEKMSEFYENEGQCRQEICEAL
jgi:hypothetical protein